METRILTPIQLGSHSTQFYHLSSYVPHHSKVPNSSTPQDSCVPPPSSLLLSPHPSTLATTSLSPFSKIWL